MASALLPSDENPVDLAEHLIAEGRPREAADLLQSLLGEGRGGVLLRTTLVSALIGTGDIDGAIAVARETALLNPSAAIAAISLGEALLGRESLAAAIGEFQRALRLDPESARARFGMGKAWLEAGEPDRAAEAFEAIAAADRPADFASCMAEAQRMRTRPRSDPRYVRHLFDEFSTAYDARMLGQLSYGAPAILRQLAETVGVLPCNRYSILDLGCGTGLSGSAFADISSRLDGLDLSASMIEKARERGIYNELLVGDIEDWSDEGRRADGYDLIIAADTLVYLGDLSRLMDVVAHRLSEGGFFLFTVEAAESAEFELGPKRRWRHSESYLRSQANGAGLDIAGLVTCNPRTEAGVPVPGFAAAFRNVASVAQFQG